MKQAIPVAGVDVSKHFSDMCILAPNNDILSRMKIYHDLTSMGRVAAELRRVEAVCGVAPVVVMESTSHYHLILFQFFRDAGYDWIRYSQATTRCFLMWRRVLKGCFERMSHAADIAFENRRRISWDHSLRWVQGNYIWT